MTTFSDLPLELIVHISTITRDPAILLNMMLAYKPLALFVKEREKTIKTLYARTITEPLCIFSTQRVTTRLLQVKQLQFTDDEFSHCKSIATSYILNAMRQDINNKLILLVTKSRFNVLPNGETMDLKVLSTSSTISYIISQIHVKDDVLEEEIPKNTPIFDLKYYDPKVISKGDLMIERQNGDAIEKKYYKLDGTEGQAIWSLEWLFPIIE